MKQHSLSHIFRAMAFAVVGASCTQVPYGIAEGGTNSTASLELAPPKGGRTLPVVVVLADTGGTETTDFIVPYGVLKESGVAEVVAVSTVAAPVRLFPALRMHADFSLAEFDSIWPEGADIVIVPALHRWRRPEVLDWLRSQAANGAVVVGICDGVRTVAAAGLLSGRSATGHWFSLKSLSRSYRDTRWVADRRYVVDGVVMTTAGVSASVPASLAIVEAIAGQSHAAATADRLGFPHHTVVHDTSEFSLTPRHVLSAAVGVARFWRTDRIVIPVENGVDEIALALMADAWSRTFRSKAIAVADDEGVFSTRRGLLVETEAQPRRGVRRPLVPPGDALDAALADIAATYGGSTAHFVAAQLEYSWPDRGRPGLGVSVENNVGEKRRADD